MSRKALGRGLGALIPGADEAETSERMAPQPARPAQPSEVALTAIRPNPYQPRSAMEPGALEELARSIKENGLIQPLVVRSVGEGTFELIAGERRFQASKQAGLTHVPVHVRDVSARDMLQMALVENLQREDLNPIEEAEAYQRLATEFGLIQEEIAKAVGKSRTAVTNALRLLSLSPELIDMVSRGTLSAGHARALLSLPDDRTRQQMAKLAVAKGLSVRQLEALCQQQKPGTKPVAKKRSHPALEAWEGRLRERFGTQVRIAGGIARGKVEIQYFTEEDLERILELTGVTTNL